MLSKPQAICIILSPVTLPSTLVNIEGRKNIVGYFSIFSFFFFKYKFIYFNWRLITLQYCIGFAIHQHKSVTGIHVFPIPNPPISPYHPSGLSQCTSPKQPVSCIELGLVIRFIYDIIHVSMPFSQIIPPSPTSTESERLFYTASSS